MREHGLRSDSYIAVMVPFQSKHMRIERIGDSIAALTLDRDQSKVNYLDHLLLDELERAIDTLAQTGNLRLLLLKSGKSANFCHGPSPASVAHWKQADFASWSERGQAFCQKLSALPLPSVCMIGSSCADAGLELATACDYRVVMDVPSVTLSFQAISWGLVPCWGGTQRLPHLMGLENSIRFLLAGQSFGARRSWQVGLADFVAEDEEHWPDFLAHPRKRDWTTFPRTNWKQRWLEPNRVGRWFLLRGAERIARTRFPDATPAPFEVVSALRHVHTAPMPGPGLEVERQAITRIAQDPAIHNMTRMLAHREALRIPTIGPTHRSGIRQVAVMVKGMTGLIVYLHAVLEGHDVVFRAETKEALAMGLLQISKLLELEVRNGSMPHEQMGQIMARFRGTYTWTHFDKTQLVIDAGELPLEERRSMYRDMEQHVSPTTIVVLASALVRVSDLQSSMKHPERLVGMRLIEPWNRVALAELVATPSTKAECMKRVRNWAIDAGKCCLQTPDAAGGLTMRIWMAGFNEAAVLVKEGIAIDRIDRAMCRYGMPHGPLEWIDRLGLDYVASLAAAVQPLFEGRIRFESGFSLMVDKGWLGDKADLGFYAPGLRSRCAHAEAVLLWKAQSEGVAPCPAPVLSDHDLITWIQTRIVTVMVLESLRCLDEGMANDSDDLDCAMCLTGWPAHRGGPIGNARQVGANALLATCDDLSRQFGSRFARLASLERYLPRPS